MAKSAFGDDLIDEPQSPQGSVSAFGDSFVDEPAAPRRADTPSPLMVTRGNDKKAQFEPLINSAAQKYGLDPKLFSAQIEAESSFNPKALGPSTRFGRAQGLGQLLPSTAQELGVADPFDPVQNLDGAARYMRQLLDSHGGDYQKALAAYNWGPGNMQRHGLDKAPKETKDYIAKIQRNAATGAPPGNPAVERFIQENLGDTGKEALLAAGRVAQGIGQGFFNDLPAAGAQLTGTLVPDSLERMLSPGGQTINEGVQSEEDAYQQARARMGGEGFDVSRMAGNIINPASLATGAAGQTPAMLARFGPKVQAALGGAMRGATGAALMPVDTSGNNTVLGQKAQQIGLGGAAGGALGGTLAAAGQGIGKLVGAARNQLDPKAAAVLEYSKAHGIPVAASDVEPGNKFYANVVGSLENIRVPGLSAAPFREAQQGAARSSVESLLAKEASALQNMAYRQLPEIEKVAAGGGKRAAEAKRVLQMIADAGPDEKKIMQASGNLTWLRHKIGADKRYGDVFEMAKDMEIDPQGTIGQLQKLMQQMPTEIGANNADINLVRGWLDDLVAPTAAAVDDPTAAAVAQMTGQADAPVPNTYARMANFKSMVQSLKDQFTINGKMDSSKLFLNRVIQGIDEDIGKFMDENPAIAKAQSRADEYYKTQVVPFHSSRLAKALVNETPENIWASFIRSKSEGTGDYAAKQFYRALDNKGQQAVRYGIVQNALNEAVEPRGFDPKKFMDAIERTEYAPYFDRANKAEVQGMLNFFGHLRKASPEHLDKYTPIFGGNGGLATYMGLGPIAAGASLGGITGAAQAAGTVYGAGAFLKWLMLSDAGKRILFSSNVLAKGGSSEKAGQLLDKAVQQFSAQSGGRVGAQIGLQGQMPNLEERTNGTQR